MKLDHFSLKHDEAYILPTLREIREINPSLFLLASPWSPPGWMKTYGTTVGGRTTENYLGPYTHSLWDLSNKSMLGGWMSENYLDVYSRYLDKFLQGLCAGRRTGAGDHCSERNRDHPEWQDAGLPLVACLRGDVYSRSFRPAVASAAPADADLVARPQLHLYQRVESQLEDKQLAKYVDGVAWHGYDGYTRPNEPGAPERSGRSLLLDRGWSLYRRSGLRHGLGQVGRHLHRYVGELVPLRDYLEPDARSQGKAEHWDLTLAAAW